MNLLVPGMIFIKFLVRMSNFSISNYKNKKENNRNIKKMKEGLH